MKRGRRAIALDQRLFSNPFFSFPLKKRYTKPLKKANKKDQRFFLLQKKTLPS